MVTQMAMDTQICLVYIPVSATPLLYIVWLFCFCWSREVEALVFCFGVRITSDGLRDINITPKGSFYIHFLDSKVNKYVFHIHFIYNSRNIHSQINSWNYYVIISLPWLLSPTFPWMLHYGNVALLWEDQVTLFWFVSSNTRDLMTSLVLSESGDIMSICLE